MNRGEFAGKLRNGHITDYTKYITGNKVGYKGFREEMARQGICVEELVELGEPGVKQRLIENGYAKEHYETWAKESDPNVVQTLVAHGYCLDILSESTNEKIQLAFIHTEQAKHMWLEWAKTASYKVRWALRWYEECAEILANDPTDEIRSDIVKRYPQYLSCLIGKKGYDTFRAIQKVLASQATPERKAYNYYMKFRQQFDPTNRRFINELDDALVAKYEALSAPITPLTATMHWEQLREIGNPLWMANKSANEIIALQN